ncbi:MAG: hypothetical protein QF371_03390 [Flavobacteriales bacterium]|nr:hypothetical protein [Flavobacteriales bacterium]
MRKLKNVIGVISLLILVVFASSCRKNKEAKVLITVLKDSVNFVTLDTVAVPAVQASVRFYLDHHPLTAHIDTTILTNTNGKAEFIWFEDAIIQYDVVYGIFSSLENFVILEQGETQEYTVNVSAP